VRLEGTFMLNVPCTIEALHKSIKTASNHAHKKIPWPEFASELYRPSDPRLSAKLVPTFANIECRVFSATDPYALFSVF
jgi:hypothetical protein